MSKKDKEELFNEIHSYIDTFKTSMMNEFKSYIDKKIQEVQSELNVKYGDDMADTIGDIIKKHLSIDVDGYYEAYSGQNEHYHKVDIGWYTYGRHE